MIACFPFSLILLILPNWTEESDEISVSCHFFHKSLMNRYKTKAIPIKINNEIKYGLDWSIKKAEINTMPTRANPAVIRSNNTDVVAVATSVFSPNNKFERHLLQHFLA